VSSRLEVLVLQLETHLGRRLTPEEKRLLAVAEMLREPEEPDDEEKKSA
jgi:hypothetical protein